MKKNNNIWIGLFAIIFLFSACDSLLDVNSERIVSPEDNILNSSDNVIYSMNGLYSELNKIADAYVLYGELRGDLLDVTENASDRIRDINNFNNSNGNPLIKSQDYYSIINNCNYIIATIDTSIVQHAEKVLYREFSAVKAIRAWTYMQLALNFGSAKYYTEPLMTVAEALNVDIPEYELNELADALIADLLPWKEFEAPESYAIGDDVRTGKLVFPARFILGELYLWKGDYNSAAQEFYDLIYENEYTINESSRSGYEVENNAFVEDRYIINWATLFDFDEPEIITYIAGSTENGTGSLLDSLFMYDYEIMPSAAAVTNWETQTYYHTPTVYRDGDRRGYYGSYYTSSQMMSTDVHNFVMKYSQLVTEASKAVIVYRIGTLYLRYAEAVNRAGKPNLAYATIKNGLSTSTMRVDSIVPPSEKYIGYTEDSVGIWGSYTNFEAAFFDNNFGVRERGCGNTHLVKRDVFDDLQLGQDSIEYIEDLILNELALETAFEGNRFHDLMRIAKRRNDPSILADKVAAKHVNNKEAIRNLLMDENNWYITEE